MNRHSSRITPAAPTVHVGSRAVTKAASGARLPTFRWPVYGFSDYFKREPIATFLDWSDAVSFVGKADRHLYIGKPEPVTGWALAEQSALARGQVQS